MSKLIKKSNHFDLRYRQYVRNVVMSNSRENVKSSKNQDGDYDINLKKYVIDYENVNQTIIGSQLMTLLFQARQERDKYMQSRVDFLKNIYKFVVENHAWYDLWKTFTMIETVLFNDSQPITHQLAVEINDMFRMNMEYPKWVVGLKDKQTPILRKTTFYMTPGLIDFIEDQRSTGRKKGRQMEIIKYQVAEMTTYHSYSFGLYSEDTLDLLPKNGMRYEAIKDIQLPRQLANLDDLSEFVNSDRQYTMNPNGVVIDCYNCGDIDQVILVEKEEYLLWKVHFNKTGYTLNHKGELVDDLTGMELSGYFNADLFPRCTFSEHSDFIEFEFRIYEFIMECYADIVCGATKVNKKFKRDVVNVGTLEMLENPIDNLNDKIGLRFIPRETHKRIKQTTQSKTEYENELKKYFVVGHVRKLPNGHSPSKEAVAHAEEYGIELPSNYTFVRPYESGEDKLRSHYIKKV